MQETQSELNEEMPTENAMTFTFETIMLFVSTNGWFLAIGSLLAYFLWQKMKAFWYKWQDERDNAQYHKDPDVALARMEAMGAARRRFQERHDVDAAAHLERTKQREQQRRIEKMKDRDTGQSDTKAKKESERTTPSMPNRSKPLLRSNDYNPLTGTGGSSRYRPSSRSCFGPSGGGA